jgi:hypothetical protein
MLGQLGIHRALDQPLGQPRQQAIRAGDVLRCPGAGQQLVDDRRAARAGVGLAVGRVLDDRDLLVSAVTGPPLRESPAAGAAPRGHATGATIAS